MRYDFHGSVSGFDLFCALNHKQKIIQTVVKKQLTKYLSKRVKLAILHCDANNGAQDTVTEPLSKEATFANNMIFGKDTEWKEIAITDGILQLIARLSSKFFLGEELCRNEAWLKLSKDYTVKTFKLGLKMSVCPSSLKFLVPWFSDEAKVIGKDLNDVRTILTPIVKRRNQLKAEARKKGEPIPSFNDAIEWLEQESKGAAYDPATFLLADEASQPLRHHLGSCIYIRCQPSSHNTLIHLFPVLSIS